MLFSLRDVSSIFSILLVVWVAMASPAGGQESAEDEDKSPWSGQAEASLVATEGNSEATTVGFAGSLERAYEGGGTFKLAASVLRADTGTTRRRAVGRPDDFRLIEVSNTETTAENYEVKVRYEQSLNERRAWYSDFGWQRDEFAGFDSRLSVGGGLTFVVHDSEERKLRFELGATWTRQEDLVGLEEDFPGARVAIDAFRALTATTDFFFKLEIDDNLDDTEDLRADLTTALQVAINKKLALKVSLDLRYDNLPALVAVPLEDLAGVATSEAVLLELDELDSTLQAALVVKF